MQRWRPARSRAAGWPLVPARTPVWASGCLLFAQPPGVSVLDDSIVEAGHKCRFSCCSSLSRRTGEPALNLRGELWGGRWVDGSQSASAAPLFSASSTKRVSLVGDTLESGRPPPGHAHPSGAADRGRAIVEMVAWPPTFRVSHLTTGISYRPSPPAVLAARHRTGVQTCPGQVSKTSRNHLTIAVLRQRSQV